MEQLTHRYTITTITLSIGTYLAAALLVWAVAKSDQIGEKTKRLWAPISKELSSLFTTTEDLPSKGKKKAEVSTASDEGESTARASGLRKIWRGFKTDVGGGVERIGDDIP